jgi:hypothetical protein
MDNVAAMLGCDGPAMVYSSAVGQATIYYAKRTAGSCYLSTSIDQVLANVIPVCGTAS